MLIYKNKWGTGQFNVFLRTLKVSDLISPSDVKHLNSRNNIFISNIIFTVSLSSQNLPTAEKAGPKAPSNLRRPGVSSFASRRPRRTTTTCWVTPPSKTRPCRWRRRSRGQPRPSWTWRLKTCRSSSTPPPSTGWRTCLRTKLFRRRFQWRFETKYLQT